MAAFSLNVCIVILLTRSVNGKYTGAEIRSKQGYPTVQGPLHCVKVEWTARPAIGNCVITLFSLFNGDLALTGETDHRPVWSEIGFETFGGSAASPNESQFQTQLISQESSSSAKRQHMVDHNGPSDESANNSNIFDHGFHTFAIEFCPDNNNESQHSATHPNDCAAHITYWLDGNVIRTEIGNNDVCHLVTPLDVYTSTWVTTTKSTWACSSTSNEARPMFAEAVVASIRVYQDDAIVQNYVFRNDDDVQKHWDTSDWGFEQFDGVYSPSNIEVFRGEAFLKLIQITSEDQ